MANLAEEARISGFHNLSTLRTRGFTEKFLAEMQIILEKMYARPIVRGMETFYTDLPQHLYNTELAHEFDITQWSKELINQLYISYRNCGYNGTVSDMLHAIAKFIDLATNDDVALGISETKAINPEQWRILFKAHASRKSAHDPLFKPFTELKVFTCDLGFHFDWMFPENYDIFDNQYVPSNWNTSHGTFFCEFTYKYPLTREEFPETIDICQFRGLDRQAKIKITVDKAILEYDGHSLVLPFSQNMHGIEKLLIIYTPDTITLRDQLSSVDMKVDQHFFTTAPLNFTCLAPLRQVGDPISIREVSYYPRPASEVEQVFFLN